MGKHTFSKKIQPILSKDVEGWSRNQNFCNWIKCQMKIFAGKDR